MAGKIGRSRETRQAETGQAVSVSAQGRAAASQNSAARRDAKGEASDEVAAALLIIGEEILSGRTLDTNTGYIAKALGAAGVSLREARTVPDEENAIVEAVDALRARYRYVFTTGGIGPTHDDITTDAVARAFGVSVAEDPRALAAMQERYPGRPLTAARRRMARIPQGAELIPNPISGAPGFRIDNVIVMAGVPAIMQAMLAQILPRLDHGRPMLARSVRIDAPESDVAPGLAAVQAAHMEVQIGSYPFFEQSAVGTVIVLRSREELHLEAAITALWSMIDDEGFPASLSDDNGKPTAKPG